MPSNRKARAARTKAARRRTVFSECSRGTVTWTTTPRYLRLWVPADVHLDARRGGAVRPARAPAVVLTWHDDSVLLADVVAVSTAVASTRARTAKARAIADLLRQAGTEEVEAVTAWLAGEPR